MTELLVIRKEFHGQNWTIYESPPILRSIVFSFCSKDNLGESAEIRNQSIVMS
jgi:hypothetical protein